MQPNGAILIPAPDTPIAPAVTCAVECARAWSEALNLEPVDPQAPARPANDAVWVIAAIDFRQLADALSAVSSLVPRDATLIGYVFDGFFSKRLEKLPSAAKRATGLVRKLRRFSAIYSPVRALIDRQAGDYGIALRYMPIGVDAVRFGAGGKVAQRFVSVNGYGRQPPELTAALADHFNRAGDGFFHFTSHAQLGLLTDPVRHRDHFWQMLRHSRIALAYAPEAYDPHGRFPCSFLGQRWYESLAAGCVVAGRRPLAPETAELLDWPEATVELPDAPEEALEALIELSADTERLEAMSLTNHERCLKQHDWRVRAAQIVEEFPQVFSV